MAVSLLATSPKQRYRDACEQRGFVHDPAQQAAVDELDTLWHALIDFKLKRNRFLGRSLRSPVVPQGLYLWGGVGRGKSFLMDTFYEQVPYRRKRRVHFHAFMAEVHRRLRELREHDDPLLALAAQLAKETRLLCFDEFHVSDIADAMILGRLLGALFEHGTILVATSNYAPDDLYPNGLQRQNFLPTIDLIKNTLKVINVDGGQDYRLRTLTREPLFIVPNGESATAQMQQLFTQLTGGVAAQPGQIQILGRDIATLGHAPGVIWFDFLALCDGPRSQNDYLQLAGEYHTVLVSNIPQLAAHQANIARRFTWLVDVLYDHRVKLIASAAVPVDQLYTEGVLANEFFRTASRLTEMQSREYLALPHLNDAHEVEPVADTAMTRQAPSSANINTHLES